MASCTRKVLVHVRNWHPWELGLGLSLIAVLGWLYSQLISPDLVGYLYDDGMYLMSGRALWQGFGYQLPGIVDQPWFYKYPPLFPAWLGLADHLAHRLSETPLLLLKALNVGVMLTVFALLGYYYRRIRHLSLGFTLGAIAVLGLNWRLAEVSVELMSEPLFLLFCVLLVIRVEKCTLANQTPSNRELLAWSILSMGMFYTRTIGILLIVALALWLWLKHNRAQAIRYGVVSGWLAMPWLVWAYTQPERTWHVGNFLVRTFQESYFQSFRMDLQYEYSLPTLYTKGLNALFGHFSIHLFPSLEHLLTLNPTPGWGEPMVLLVSGGLLTLLGLRGWRNLRQRQYSLVGVYLSVYLAILPFWSFFKFYPRFVAVLLPFLVLLLLLELRERWPKAGPTLGIFLLLSIATANLIYLQPYWTRPSSNLLSIHADLAGDYQHAFQWVRRHVPASATLYTDNGDEAFMWALHTERPVADFFLFLPPERLPAFSGLSQRQAIQALQRVAHQRATVLQAVLPHYGVRYVIANRASVIKSQTQNRHLAYKDFQDVLVLAQRNPAHWATVYTSPSRWITIYRLDRTIQTLAH